MASILIAEDEQRIASFINKGLSANGFAVTVVADGPSAYDYARTGNFDLMVLDIGLPGMDGFEVLRRLRSERNRIPVVVLTARDSLHDTVAGLEGGADDYMAKPFRFEELLARIRVRLSPDRVSDAMVLSCGGLQLDLRTRRARVDGNDVDLSAREFALAETFLRHPGQVLSREQLLSQVWGYDYDPGSNVVDVYVRYLRRKLGVARFVTLTGHGLPARRGALAASARTRAAVPISATAAVPAAVKATASEAAAILEEVAELAKSGRPGRGSRLGRRSRRRDRRRGRPGRSRRRSRLTSSPVKPTRAPSWRGHQLPQP